MDQSRDRERPPQEWDLSQARVRETSRVLGSLVYVDQITYVKPESRFDKSVPAVEIVHYCEVAMIEESSGDSNDGRRILVVCYRVLIQGIITPRTDVDFELRLFMHF